MGKIGLKPLLPASFFFIITNNLVIITLYVEESEGNFMAYGLLYDFYFGQTIDAYQYFGAHFTKQGNKKGVIFRLYAPGASDVSVIGEFNDEFADDL